MTNPAQAVGHVADDDAFLGSCFLVGQHVALTAKHVVCDSAGSLLQVHAHFPQQTQPADSDSNLRNIIKTAVHPVADLAVLILDPLSNELEDEFSFLFDLDKVDSLKDGESQSVGQTVGTYGFRFEHPMRNSNAQIQTPRFLGGYVQRHLEPCSEQACKYHPPGMSQIELSFLVPEGMSGGPVFTQRHRRLAALCTGNQTTERFVERHTTISEDDKPKIEETTRSFVHYGLALRLDPYVPWVKEQIASAT